MAVDFAKIQEKRVPAVLSTNYEISPFQIPYRTEVLTPACPAEPKILFMEVGREDEADLQVLIPMILCFVQRPFFVG